MEPVTFAEQAWDGEPGRLGSLLGGPGRLGPPILVGGEWGGTQLLPSGAPEWEGAGR